ncbi:MAG: efflux RND transporter periplasmic adaptor subunit [Syntrophobacterales bacterium]|nr:MAG: efflux RND transporter periplasmic adaptor subunit [Syntrophobacterales bacterium]
MKRLIYYLIMISFSLLPVSCMKGDETPSEKSLHLSPITPEVIVQEIVRGPIYKTYTSLGTVAASDFARITPKVAGRIKTIRVEEGDRVERGELLMLIDPFDYEQALQNTAAIKNQAKVNLERLKRDLARMESLYQQKSVSQQTFQDTESAQDLSLYAYDQAVVSHEIAKRNLEECSVSAPISGIVTQKGVNIGELTSPTQLAFVIMNMDTVKVEVDLPEEIFSSIHEGGQAIITLDAIPDKTFTGKITKIYPTIDPMSRTFKVTLTLTNPALLLRSGMTARSKVIQKSREAALCAPKSSLVQGEQGYLIYIINADTVKKSPVKVGMEGDSVIEIIEGVSEGDLVVTTGLAGLRDGMGVRISEQVSPPKG